jgi:hypothetical protein
MPHFLEIRIDIRRGAENGAEGSNSLSRRDKNPMSEERKPCECGCGEYPKDPNSRFLPGHNTKSIYQNHPEQDQEYEEVKDRERFGGE